MNTYIHMHVRYLGTHIYTYILQIYIHYNQSATRSKMVQEQQLHAELGRMRQDKRPHIARNSAAIAQGPANTCIYTIIYVYEYE